MKQFLPFLTDDQGRSLAVDNEVVVTRSLPDPLNNSPEGWENNTIQFARNNEFRGLVKSFTTSLKFYLEGAKILRDTFYRKGMETVLFFIWLKLDQSFGGGLKHLGWFKGEPDFGTFKDEYDGVSINIAEGGFFKQLQANKTVVQEVPFDDDRVSLFIDNVNLHQKLNYSDVEGVEVSLAAYGTNFFGPYVLVSNDGASTGFLIGSEQLEEAPAAYADRLLSLNTVLTNTGSAPIDVTISGTIEFECIGMTSSPAWALRFRYLRSNLPIGDQNDYQVMSTAAMVVGTIYTQDFSVTIPLEPGERLYREGIFFGGVGSDAIIQFTDNSTSSINFITRATPAIIDAFRAFDLGNKLTAKVGPGSALISPFLDGDANLLISSGDAIRALPGPLKTSFSDWHKSVDAVKCIALDVVDNNPVVSDRYDKFNKDSTIASLGECSNWELEPAHDYIYDGVNVGYPAKQADSNIDVNGKYSFNNTFIWKINTTRRDASPYDAVSKYFADPYDISLIRTNLEGKTTTTGGTDNSIFFFDGELMPDILFDGVVHYYAPENRIELSGDIEDLLPFIIPGVRLLINGQVWTVASIFDVTGLTNIIFDVREFVPASIDVFGTAQPHKLYRLRRPAFDTITGVPDDGTVFNIMLSPRRILDRHLRWLRSSFDHLDSNKLVLQSTEKNKDLVTTLGGVTVNEKADIPVATMGARVFLPYYTTFDIRSPENLLSLMTANNAGVFQYERQGVAMDGFVIDVKSQDATLATQNYKLLMSANNDNTRLINGR